jgi:D-alanyl-D-alanine carboxypeptidase
MRRHGKTAARMVRSGIKMPASMRARAFVSWCVLICLAWSTPFGGSAAASTLFVIDVPKITARAVYAIDVTAGVELYADHADDRRSPASTTKLATAIVVVDTVSDLSQPVTVEELDMGLQPGDVLTVRQLLEGILIHSGSDATYAAARFTGNVLLAQEGNEGDPVAAFVKAMNEVAADLKLKNTHFMNPVGIDQKDHYSSARDLASLANEALKRPVIAEIVAQRSLQTVIEGPNRREVTLENTNQLLDDGAIHGVKTGSTSEAGACLVLAKWEHGTNRVITVVLGSDLAYDDEGFITNDKRWDDTRALLKAIEREVTWIAPSEPDEVPGLHDELAAWQVVLKDDSAILVPADHVRSLRYLLQLGPAGKPNSQVGYVLFFVGSEKIAERPVFQAPLA